MASSSDELGHCISGARMPEYPIHWSVLLDVDLPDRLEFVADDITLREWPWEPMRRHWINVAVASRDWLREDMRVEA